MNICLFEQSELNGPLDLSDARAQHIIKILHKKEGDTFSAGVIDGSAGIALIKKIETYEEQTSKGKTFTAGKIYFEFTPESDGKILRPVSLIVGFPRPIQLKRLLRDVAALGVKNLHLVKTQLGEKSYAESDLSSPQSCRTLLVEGCEQAASTHIPKVFFHQSVNECLLSLAPRFPKSDNDFCPRVAFDNVQPSMGIGEFVQGGLYPSSGFEIFIAVGSERGWSQDERDTFTKNGFDLVGLGPRVLRTETAVTVGTSIIMASAGLLEK